MHPMPGGHSGSGGVPTTSAKEGPAVASIKVGKGVVGVATNGCPSVIEEHVTAPGLTLVAMATPDSVPDPNGGSAGWGGGCPGADQTDK